MTVAVVLKGYPRLSETFIAQEILALQERGLRQRIISLRHPTDRDVHPMHRAITAPVNYLPEYLYQEPRRVLRAWRKVRRWPTYRSARAAWLRDWARDRTANRGRRFGQALVLAAELPGDVTHLHVHFLHTPASVVRYAAALRELPWSVSAHAKDIWTTPAWEKAEKLAACEWLVTCTRAGRDHLAGVAAAEDRGKVALLYHGLDLSRFPAQAKRPPRDGSDANDPVRILSVARAVPKKGFEVLLDALAALPKGRHWRFVHIGGGPLLPSLRRRAEALGIADRVAWRGAKAQTEVIRALAEADLFVLASRVAADGDRDGLPNVLMEAQAMGLACVSTNIAAIPELIEDGSTGLLVDPDSPGALAAAIDALIADPARRATLAAAGERRTRSSFSFESGIALLADRFGLPASVVLAAED